MSKKKERLDGYITAGDLSKIRAYYLSLSAADREALRQN